MMEGPESKRMKLEGNSPEGYLFLLNNFCFATYNESIVHGVVMSHFIRKLQILPP